MCHLKAIDDQITLRHSTEFNPLPDTARMCRTGLAGDDDHSASCRTRLVAAHKTRPPQHCAGRSAGLPVMARAVPSLQWGLRPLDRGSRSLDGGPRHRAAAAALVLLRLPVCAGVAAAATGRCGGLLARPRETELRRRPLERLVVDHEVVLRAVAVRSERNPMWTLSPAAAPVRVRDPSGGQMSTRFAFSDGTKTAVMFRCCACSADCLIESRSGRPSLGHCHAAAAHLAHAVPGGSVKDHVRAALKAVRLHYGLRIGDAGQPQLELLRDMLADLMN